MNKTQRTFSLKAVAILFAAVVVLLGSVDANAQGKLGDVLKRLDANSKDLRSLRSGLTMVKYNDQLKKFDRPQVGTISYLPKTEDRVMYARIDWKMPVAESVVIIGSDYQIYRPTLRVGYQGKTDQAKNSGSAGGALAFLNMKRAHVKEQYNSSYAGVEWLKYKEGTRTEHVVLVPKDSSSHYKKTDIWVDDHGFPRQVTVTETNGDTTTILMTGTEKNIKLKADKFRIKFPKGTEVRNT